MRQDRVYTDYRRWADTALATLAGRTLEFMTGNAAFADPQPDLVAYAALVTDYRQKLETARSRGSVVEVKAKNNARRDLLRAMYQLAIYVNLTANGDAHLLASSGFTLVDQPKASRVPVAPLFVRLQDGAVSGEMNMSCEPVAGAWEYEYQVASEIGADGMPLWGDIRRFTNSRRETLSGLIPGVLYYTRVRARNSKGEGDWSVTASQYAR